MLVDYMELGAALDKVRELENDICRLRVESSESKQIAFDLARLVFTERERCARICETLELTLPYPEHYSTNELHIISVTEAGCRGAFAAEIRRGDKGLKGQDDRRK